MELSRPNKVEFVLFMKASYLRSEEPLSIAKEDYGLLKCGEKYVQLGSKTRTSFGWKEPIEYSGMYYDKKSDTRYVLFGASNELEKDETAYWCYAFPCLTDQKTLVHFSTSMQSCREIKIDTVK